ncbi:MAG: metal-sensing transcriptional repressor [Patescibacteria group bacterium]|jgi:DNA-binding FrmR family transcriptional regulator
MKHQPIYNRLRRIEGQVRGIGDMLGKEKPATEILIQLEAVRSSVGSTIGALVEEMIDEKSKDNPSLSSELQTLLRLIKRAG